MITVTTRQGKRIEIISQNELRDPMMTGARVRAYCHIHGSDHQRSLSIDRESGWGHCFNASCNATVLVAEWNPELAKHLLYSQYRPALPAAGGSTASGIIQPPLPLVEIPTIPSTQQAPPKIPRRPPAWQQEELLTLIALEEQMQAALARSPKARAYLDERGIPLEVALAAGVGYLAPELLNELHVPKQRRAMRRWTGRIIFPLVAPGEKGYIGRTLRYWRPGMDEATHKELLDQPRRPRRWIKTNPAGWSGCDLKRLASEIVLVEGAFDRLTLLAAGFQETQIVALVGTSAPPEWLPPQVETIILALDGDQGGHDAAARIAEAFEKAGLKVIRRCAPQDGWGKDWNERWQRIGPQSVWPLFEAFRSAAARGSSSPGLTSLPL